jgi:hypothetical protein
MRTRSNRTRLSLESLETREVPAGGVVTFTALSGSVTLTGDNSPLGNDIRVVETGANVVSLIGQNGTVVRIGAHGVPAGQITGIQFTNNLLVNLGTGPDHFEYDGAFAGKVNDITLNMGAGNDTVAVSNVLARNFTVNQGSSTSTTDNDLITIANGSNQGGGFRGTVTLNDGGGNDQVQITAGVAGDLKIQNTDGGDAIAVSGVVAGNVVVSDTAGNSQGNNIQITNLGVGNSLTITSPGNFPQLVNIAQSFIGGGLTVTAGSSTAAVTVVNLVNSSVGQNATINGGVGHDSVTVGGVHVGRNLSIANNDGENLTTVTDATLGGSLSVSGTQGIDVVSVGNNGTVFVAGDGNFNLGNGQNTLTLGSANAQPVTFGGSVKVNMGSGVDSVVGQFLVVLGGANISTGAGNDTVTFGGSMTVGGNTVINTGADNDVVTANANPGSMIALFGGLNLTFGAGTDTLNAGNAGFGQVVLFGALTGDFSTGLEVPNIGANFIRVGGVS